MLNRNKTFVILDWKQFSSVSFKNRITYKLLYMYNHLIAYKQMIDAYSD